jgi:uncharacterized RDD family membrane protein YckC
MQAKGLSIDPTVRTAIAYAGFWRRLLAHLIDVTVLVTIQVTLALGALTLEPQAFSSIDAVGANAVSRALAWDIVAFAENVATLWLVWAALTWAYYSILESSPMRASVGKAALGLFVGDLYGDPITFSRASARYWLKTLSSMVLMTGWLMAAFTPRKQALHDLLSGTLVLHRVAIVTPWPNSDEGPGDYWDGTGWVGAMGPAQEV